MVRLTDDEQLTMDSYARIAAKRAATHNKPSFWEKEFEKYRALLPSGKVLDAGCGSGRDALMFTPAGYDYVGVDLSQEMLAQARLAAPNAAFQQMDLYRFKFGDSSFDGFWAAASLIHAPRDRVDLMLYELQRVTRNNGVGFIAMKEGYGTRRSENGDDKRVYTLYEQDEFAHIINTTGLKVIEADKNLAETAPGCNGTVWLTYFVRA